ncbi:MAG: BrnT family toxin [Alcaligenaceae bacterium]|nr:BrnT family toxin [Alcaligenaceae bacterium]
MRIQFDPAKNESNYTKHGVFLTVAEKFEWDTALCASDDRIDYKETRISCIGYIGQRLYVIVYTERGTSLRVISLRKANLREVKRYAET